MHRLIIAMGMVAAICFAAGCGGSGSEADSAPLSKARYTEQAEAICTRATAETQKDAAAWKKGFPGGPAEAEEHAEEGIREVLIPVLQREAEQLEALEPPAKDKLVVARFVGNLSQATEILKKKGLNALPESGALEFRQEAATYGLKSCGGAL